MEIPFELPRLLLELVESGRWPATRVEAMGQNRRACFPVDRVKLFAEDEEKVYLEGLPFSTLSDEFKDNTFWDEIGAAKEISPAMALVIGDMGMGSDAPIVLDYRSMEQPRVLRLKWTAVKGRKPATHWVQGAESFEQFVEMLGLKEMPSGWWKRASETD